MLGLVGPDWAEIAKRVGYLDGRPDTDAWPSRLRHPAGAAFAGGALEWYFLNVT
jgi:hypothetical protein